MEQLWKATPLSWGVPGSRWEPGDEMKRPPKEVRQTEESMSCLWTSAWADVCDSDSVHGSHDMFPMSFGHTQKFQVLTGTTADSPTT